MKLSLEEIVKTNLTKCKIEPDSQKGRPFLINEGTVALFYREVSPRDVVIEINPGFGQITQEIVKKAKRVIAVEVDNKFYVPLKAIEARNRNLDLKFNDVSTLDFNILLNFKRNRVVIFGNLPHHILETLFDKSISLPVRELFIITGIRFVNDVTSVPGDVNFGKLTILVNTFYTFEVVRELPANYFYPQATTSFALIRFVPKQKTDYKDRKLFILRELILSASKSKKLKNVLKDSFIKFAGSLKLDLTQNQALELISSMPLSPETLEKSFNQLNNEELSILVKELNGIINKE